MSAPTRPALRWHGGKWRLAPWIIAHFPPHRVYVEPFGGAASVLLRKPRAHAEVYNDLDDDAVALFRVLRDPAGAAELERRIRLTPFARTEFEAAYAVGPTEMDRAWAVIVRSSMGHGSNGHNAELGRTGFRANANRSHTTPARDWKNLPANIAALTARLAGVVIERRPALDVMRKHDGPETLHYVDPPYLAETRHDGRNYRHEMTAADHAELLAFLATLQGMVVLSGYKSPLYADAAALLGWRKSERASLADGARPRVECLWLNPACAAARAAPAMFEEVS